MTKAIDKFNLDDFLDVFLLKVIKFKEYGLTSTTKLAVNRIKEGLDNVSKLYYNLLKKSNDRALIC